MLACHHTSFTGKTNALSFAAMTFTQEERFSANEDQIDNLTEAVEAQQRTIAVLIDAINEMRQAASLTPLMLVTSEDE